MVEQVLVTNQPLLALKDRFVLIEDEVCSCLKRLVLGLVPVISERAVEVVSGRQSFRNGRMKIAHDGGRRIVLACRLHAERIAAIGWRKPAYVHLEINRLRPLVDPPALRKHLTPKWAPFIAQRRD